LVQVAITIAAERKTNNNVTFAPPFIRYLVNIAIRRRAASLPFFSYLRSHSRLTRGETDCDFKTIINPRNQDNNISSLLVLHKERS
jgi:hypothetical protein